MPYFGYRPHLELPMPHLIHSWSIQASNAPYESSEAQSYSKSTKTSLKPPKDPSEPSMAPSKLPKTPFERIEDPSELSEAPFELLKAPSNLTRPILSLQWLHLSLKRLFPGFRNLGLGTWVGRIFSYLFQKIYKSND